MGCAAGHGFDQPHGEAAGIMRTRRHRSSAGKEARKGLRSSGRSQNAPSGAIQDFFLCGTICGTSFLIYCLYWFIFGRRLHHHEPGVRALAFLARGESQRVASALHTRDGDAQHRAPLPRTLEPPRHPWPTRWPQASHPSPAPDFRYLRRSPHEPDAQRSPGTMGRSSATTFLPSALRML